jgi:uncharacterized protein
MGVIRTLPDDQIEALLSTAIVGRIACCAHGEDGTSARPYLVPLAYGYDGEALYAHSGPGTKITLMRANPLVTVEVDEASAPDRWSSVVAEGTYEELADPVARDHALAVIYPAGPPDLGPMTIVFRIVLTARSGRYETPS